MAGADNHVRLSGMTIRGGEAVMQMDNATPPVYPVKSKARWLIMNSLAELDRDDEYVIDRDNGAVFAKLPATTNSGLWLSLGRNVVTINNASNITLHGLRIEYATGIGLVVADSRDIKLDNLVARNHGGVAVSMEDVTSATLRGSSVGNAGCNAVRVSSGDQKTLRPGGTLIHGNNISRMGLFKRMYAGAGLRFSGVNNTFTSNTFEHGPHSGMLGGKANDCLFRDNTFQHLCEESGDSGGEYSDGLPPLWRLTQDCCCQQRFILDAAGSTVATRSSRTRFATCGTAASRCRCRRPTSTASM